MRPPTTTPEHTPQPAGGEGAPTTMRALTARTYGGPDVLALEELPVPTPADGELLVEVWASSLNALDWHFLTGTPYLMRLMFGLRRPKRFVRGVDVAGVVVGGGDGVTRFRVGDAVFGEGPGGGCTMTVQIAKALGAEVTAVCSTGNVEMVRSLGADEVIDYTRADFVAGGARFDVMLDNVGNRHPREVRSVMRPQGRYVAISGPKANRWVDPLPYILRARMGFMRADASFHNFTAASNDADLMFLGELLASGRLVPQIDRVVGLNGVAGALAEIGSGHARAKIVVVPSR